MRKPSWPSKGRRSLMGEAGKGPSEYCVPLPSRKRFGRKERLEIGCRMEKIG
jgi:hypothetical protein